MGTWALDTRRRGCGNAGKRHRQKTAGTTLATRNFVTALCLLALCSPAHSGEPRKSPFENLPPEEPAAEATSEAVPYTVAFVGTDDAQLLSTLKAASQLIELERRPPPTPARLNLRIEDDLARLNRVLNSEGYYDAGLTSEIDSGQSPAVVTVRIDPGERYRLASHEIVYEGADPPPEALRPGLKALGLEPDMAARGPRIAAAGQLWAALMSQRGYPFAQVVDRRSVINRETRP